MSSAPLLPISLTCSIALAMGVPGSAFASATAWAPARGSVEVDTSAVGEEGPALKRRIEGRARDILLDNEVLPAKDSDDPHFRVEVEPAKGDDPGWIAACYIEQGGKVVKDSTREIECNLCTEGELVDKVAEALGELVPTIVSEGSGEEADSPFIPPPATAGTTEGGSTPEPERVPKAKLGTLGYAGIGVAALGLVGVGVGAGLLAKKESVLEDDPSQLKDYKPPGAAVLAIGGVALVTGVALIVVDQVKQKKSANVAVAPLLMPKSAGLAVAGRF